MSVSQRNINPALTYRYVELQHVRLTVPKSHHRSTRGLHRATSALLAHANTGATSFRTMLPDDLPAIQRLHKFSKLNGKPVFGSNLSGVEDMLQHAANGRSSALGIVAVTQEDAMDVLGCVTAQIEDEGPPLEHSEALPSAKINNDAGSSSLCVLLTLVVRADQRHMGIGRGLLLALRQAMSKNGIRKIVTDVSSSNQPAIGFFEVSGFCRRRDGHLGNMIELQLEY